MKEEEEEGEVAGRWKEDIMLVTREEFTLFERKT